MTFSKKISNIRENFWNFIQLKRFRLNVFIKSKPELTEYPRYISNIKQVHQYIDYLDEEDDIIRISNPPYSYNPFFYHYYKVIIKKVDNGYLISDLLAYPDFSIKVDKEKLLGFLKNNQIFLNIIEEPRDFDKYATNGIGVAGGFQNKSDIKHKSTLFDFNYPKNDFGLLLSVKSETTSMHISDIADAKVYLTYLIDEEDYLYIMVVDDDLNRHTTIKIKRLKYNYLLHYTRNFPELIFEADMEQIITLFQDNTIFLEMIKEPKLFGFEAKKGFSFTNEHGKYVPLTEKTFEECINEIIILKDESVTYIYDEETSTRFAIYRKDTKFIFEMCMGDVCYIETTKEKLIELLGDDISIFTKMQEYREAFGFECESI